MNTARRQDRPIHSIPMEIAGRTSIFAVCFCFLFAIAPHFVNLPIWVSALVIIALSWRSFENLGYLKPLSKWFLIPLVLFGGVGVFAEYWTIVGRDAGLALLTVMTAFKILESRTHRDLLILIFLCYFLIATHFLFSQSIFTAALMLVTLVIITSTLITLNQRNDDVTVKERLQTGAEMVALSIPLMLVLFILVPRVSGPLWGITNEQRGGITGLSEQMSPGEISNLIRNNEVAFRVDFKDKVPSQNQLYWRGPVMAAFTGRTWRQTHRKRLGQLRLIASSDTTEYTITLEPNGKHWLLALDVPMHLVEDSFMTADYQLTSVKPLNDLKRYTLKSSLNYQIGFDENEEYFELTSSYPEKSNPKTIEFGKQLAAQYQNPEDIVQHVLRMFRQQEYTYTLSPPLLRGDVVDQFLFESRRGFCEHFSGSFALLMRAAGIPSRIVTGYQGGEFNAVGNYLIVRQSDAHAWTEIWLEGKGWVRIDPTAAVSPSRIEQGIDDALADERSSFRIQNKNPLFGTLLYRWDNLQHGWNDWVVNYDEARQRRFLNDLDLGIDNASDMVIALVILLISVSGSFWLIGWYRDRPDKPAKHEIYFRRFLKKMARKGFDKPGAEDNRRFLKRINKSDIEQREEIGKIINLYNAIKYGRHKTLAEREKTLNDLINSIRV